MNFCSFALRSTVSPSIRRVNTNIRCNILSFIIMMFKVLMYYTTPFPLFLSFFYNFSFTALSVCQSL